MDFKYKIDFGNFQGFADGVRNAYAQLVDSFQAFLNFNKMTSLNVQPEEDIDPNLFDQILLNKTDQ